MLDTLISWLQICKLKSNKEKVPSCEIYIAENYRQTEYFSDFCVTVIEKFEFLNWAEFLKIDIFYIFEPAEFHSPSTEVKSTWIFSISLALFTLLLENIDFFFIFVLCDIASVSSTTKQTYVNCI